MAKRFQFRLAGVERVRTQERDAARREVAEAARAEAGAQRRIEGLHDVLCASMDVTRGERRREDRLDLTALKSHQLHRAFLHRQLLDADQALASRRRELDVVRTKLAETSKRLKVVETLREKQWARHLQEVRREEQAFDDEVGAQRFLRNRVPVLCEDST